MEKSIEARFHLKPSQRQGLAKLELITLRDLLYHFPARYERPAPEKMINELRADETAAIHGQVIKTKISLAFRKKIPLAEVIIEDATGRIKAVWFHQAYLAKKIHEGEWLKLSGKVNARKEQLYFANPAFQTAAEAPIFQTAETPAASYLTPIYPETRGLSSVWIEHDIKQLLTDDIMERLSDPLPPPLGQKYRLPALKEALILIHQPRTEKEAAAARKRFAFEEIFFIQLERLRTKKDYEKNGAYQIETGTETINDGLKHLPFLLTAAQERSINQILSDFKREQPMMRLLEGDVGSGKTAVAALAAYAAVRAGFEVAFMAPTEILARQHFESFIQNFRGDNINIGLITSSECRKFPSKVSPREHTHISRVQLLKWVATGDIPIVVGTHALIQKTVRFKNLALTVIDEQHRFGVKQRAALVKKSIPGADEANRVPHLLSLTATPIPRTLALTAYGDLDLTLLDELPPGRQPIITEIVTEEKRNEAYRKIKEELGLGRQAFVICPRIDLPDSAKALALYAKSAKQEARRLQEEVFPEWKVGLLHSKLRPKDKEQVMADFARGAVQILVATSVVEVGVNVPNATVIVIEGAERFGLAQLHQLRGRVWRSSYQPYCFLFTDATSGKAVERLKAVQIAKNGFELAELDLKLRGAGSLTGGKQWGLSDLGMEALQNLKMVEAARAEAKNLLKDDPTLARYPLIKDRLTMATERQIHFE
ncbi:MAG: ATP-dependent DNA helicase RecG [Candidatus Vogelbacteria bacterium]|nr:ATP-dependent DNA helicase RecG [Candidatus Vogelbacteria bacterium]